MNLLLLILSAVPLFSIELPGEGALQAVACLDRQDGYCVVLSARTGWGGSAETTLIYLDENGVPEQSYTPGSAGEPVDACTFTDGTAVLCIDAGISTTCVFTHGGTAEWTAEFPGQFAGGAALTVNGNELIVAGNDLPEGSSLRIAVLDANGIVLSNTDYSSTAFDVADLALLNGELCVLGAEELSGWQREIVLFFPAVMEEYHYQPYPGRYSPVSLEAYGDGFIVLANAMTEENGMVGETYLMKTAPDMSVEWNTSLAGRSWISAAASAVTGEGIVLTGWTNSIPLSESNRSDLFIAECSGDGELLWTREYGGDTCDYGLDVRTCPDRGFTVSGCSVDGLYEGIVLRTDSTGSLEPQGIQEEEGAAALISVLSCPGRNGTLDVLAFPGFSESVRITVIDMSGRAVHARQTLAGDRTTFNGLPSGVYLVTAEAGGISVRTRTVVLGDDQ